MGHEKPASTHADILPVQVCKQLYHTRSVSHKTHISHSRTISGHNLAQARHAVPRTLDLNCDILSAICAAPPKKRTISACCSQLVKIAYPLIRRF